MAQIWVAYISFNFVEEISVKEQLLIYKLPVQIHMDQVLWSVCKCVHENTGIYWIPGGDEFQIHWFIHLIIELMRIKIGDKMVNKDNSKKNVKCQRISGAYEIK